MRLPHYLVCSPSGTWHFRQRVPADLHPVLGTKCFKHSLRTRDLLTAQRLALDMAERYARVIRQARGMHVSSSMDGKPSVDEVLRAAKAGILILSSGWLLWRHRSGLVENDAHHLRSGYLLHEQQVRALATYPLAILQSVSRYFEKRPVANRGIHLAFSGKGNVSLATVAIGLTMVKELYDLHAFGLSASDGDVVFFVWLSLLTLLYIGVMVGWFGRREDYQRALLEGAIAVVTGLSGKSEK